MNDLKKIFWIASYPKSGNTYVRSFLSHYLFESNSTLNFDVLKKIPKFEQKKIFEQVVDKNLLNDELSYIKHSLKVQEGLIKKYNQDELIFKTHHFFGELNNYTFTNQKNTQFFIYLVRDPREVIVSFANHNRMTIEEQLISFISKDKLRKIDMEIIVNWGLHYRSWKTFKSVPSLFIKYEDLVIDPEKYFKKILLFMSKFMNIKVDLEKLKKTIDLIKFENLQHLEKKIGFKEAPKDTRFFNSGKTDSWKKKLTKEQLEKIQIFFYNEMKDLGYL